ncbi:hypothetical protein [Persicirhabdus sediminis]|uniref:DUF4034 domain-containing protein n=1 Tax=Persicirhabdus sediminis TaxID=454144 RepID=A0A8J7MGN5_9BACT|nr:hypothetical protein [Persicirhabdus sediminis]MBK1792458.1 hypothetical protein [Persicirhabdus sediminis]
MKKCIATLLLLGCIFGVLITVASKSNSDGNQNLNQNEVSSASSGNFDKVKFIDDTQSLIAQSNYLALGLFYQDLDTQHNIWLRVKSLDISEVEELLPYVEAIEKEQPSTTSTYLADMLIEWYTALSKEKSYAYATATGNTQMSARVLAQWEQHDSEDLKAFYTKLVNEPNTSGSQPALSSGRLHERLFPTLLSNNIPLGIEAAVNEWNYNLNDILSEAIFANRDNDEFITSILDYLKTYQNNDIRRIVYENIPHEKFDSQSATAYLSTVEGLSERARIALLLASGHITEFETSSALDQLCNLINDVDLLSTVAIWHMNHLARVNPEQLKAWLSQDERAEIKDTFIAALLRNSHAPWYSGKGALYWIDLMNDRELHSRSITTACNRGFRLGEKGLKEWIINYSTDEIRYNFALDHIWENPKAALDVALSIKDEPKKTKVARYIYQQFSRDKANDSEEWFIEQNDAVKALLHGPLN